MRAKLVLENKLFEAIEDHPVLSIEEFLSEINVSSFAPTPHPSMPPHPFPPIPEDKFPAIIKWWNENRSHIKIRYFPFNTKEPIAGVFMSGEDVFINKNAPAPPDIKLFIAIHESKHADQHRKGEFIPSYFDPVIANNFERFKEGYERLEKEANDYAFNALSAMNIQLPMPERMIRSNEVAAQPVFGMMKRDIEEGKIDDWFDLLKSQIF